MNVEPFEVMLFSSANLFRALHNEWCTPDEVAVQARAKYLLGYLTDIGAKTIVVENEYTDGDYLEDFASYYVRCHERYDRRCKRLHFFSAKITAEILRALCLNTAEPAVSASFVSSYLGFVVARPLPSAIVGRTLLKTYPPDAGRRQYTVLRRYPANLFGIQLEIESLPYQEQDSVLAACATVSLWCAFHKTAELFGTPAPRPAAITRAANRFGHRGRPVPSHGLRIEEMCHAVSDVGLEPELVECQGHVPLVSLAYAHLRMGLPVILVLRIESRGLHAITLTGFSRLKTRVHKQEVVGGAACIPMVGLRINEFYGHDDQIGPFAKIVVGRSASGPPVVFTGSWVDEATGKPLQLEPIAALIPVYNKIRVTFLDVQEWLTRLNAVLGIVVSDPAENMEWDVALVLSNAFKSETLVSSLSAEMRQHLLFSPQPRFLWRAILRVMGTEAVELVFDATDMARSFPLREAIWRNAGFAGAAKALCSAPAMQPSLEEALTSRFLTFLKSSLS